MASPNQPSLTINHFEVLGTIVSVWDRVDGGCLHIFRHAVPVESAEAIYFAARSFDLRLTMLRVATARTTASNELKAEGAEIFDRVQKLAGQRNAIIHGQWIVGLQKQIVRLALPDDWQQATEILAAWHTKNPKFQKHFHKHIYDTERLKQIIPTMESEVVALFSYGNKLEAALKGSH